MRKLFFLVLVLLVSSVKANANVMLAFQTMYGVDGPFVNDSSIRNVPGDELPWEVRSVHGFVTTTGHVFIKVRGLVFSDDPSVPPELRGINDEEKFRGLVSCLTEDKTGISVTNIFTRGFRATRHGNSTINDHIKLPDSCVAPIVFVMAGSENKWFAVTGAELGSDKKK
ncbi:MAG: hypothetical protein ACJ76H_11645 [Bacteriovoracaceae bacterium]